MNLIKEGLICTNENCVGCNKCIGVCSCFGATIAAESNEGTNIIKADGSKCIACGACFDACEHNAREYVDDTDSFFEDLKNGENISIMVAPAFIANYPNEYQEILGKLKTLGVNRILSVAYGANITTWAYLNYIKKYNFKGGISQPCPATVDYIEKYIPELIPKLMPVQSPMMCMAIYAKKHLGINDKLAFIGPCIAKKSEIMSKRGMDRISYNVTFDHMMKKLRKMDVTASEFVDETEFDLGSVYAMPGGLKENIHWFLGDNAYVRQVDGEKKMYSFLHENKERILSDDPLYTLYDVLNCSEGCLCGTGIEMDVISKEDTLLEMIRIGKRNKSGKKGKAWSLELSHEERLLELNKEFGELSLDDYICSYEDKSEGCVYRSITEEELEVVFEDMNKITKEDRSINCSSCGYNTCREMAEAIFNGFNHKENCVHFIKDVLEGISGDFPTVLIIHEENQSVHVVKYTGEGAIKTWIESGLALVDYNSAIKDYINRYVDDADKERLLSEVLFDSLIENLKENNHFSTIYTRHPEVGESGFFQLDFKRMEGRKDIILSYRDVDSTIREQMENNEKIQSALIAAEQANKAKSTFLANMSHEIRTPINAILGMDTMILRESNQSNVLEYARNVRSASNTLLSLINDILDFSKIESGKMEIIEGEYRLDSVINDLMNMMRGKAEEKGLELILKMQPDIPAQLIGDEVRVKQIILNLLNNAVKYTKEGSVTFEIGYEQEQSDEMTLCVWVRDTGIGIKKEDMKILFSPYERIEENRNKLIEGTGLGLSITRNLLEQMNSELVVDSIYGQGSTFSFKICQKICGDDRISQEHLSLSEASMDEEKMETYHAPDAKILVVDDVEMNITVLNSLLRRLQIYPDSCLSGKEALEYAGKNVYDIIFLDAMMPGLTGEETLQAIKKNCELNVNTPIIVLTANAIVGAKERYMREGFTNYLSKPVDGEKLERMIQRYLPKDKIKPVTKEAQDNIRKEPVNTVSDETKKQLDLLSAIIDISVENGIKATGDVETYLNICRNFYETAKSRMQMIKDYYDSSDINNYTIQVHALKSSARLIGADGLSSLAFDMEMAGKQNDIKNISEHTDNLLDMYKHIMDALEVLYNEDKKSDKKELTKKKFDRRLKDLLELMEAFDFENARTLFDDFKKYQLPADGQEIYDALKASMADVNRDDVILLLNEYFGKGINA